MKGEQCYGGKTTEEIVQCSGVFFDAGTVLHDYVCTDAKSLDGGSGERGLKGGASTSRD